MNAPFTNGQEAPWTYAEKRLHEAGRVISSARDQLAALGMLAEGLGADVMEGYLGGQQVVDQLHTAADAYGLVAEHGEGEIQRIIAEGLERASKPPPEAWARGPSSKTTNGETGNGRILPGTEFAELNTASRKVWLVHHLLAAGEVSVWYGEPGSGKSVGIEDVGLHVAAGRIWHGRKIMQSAVLYIALERFSVVARRAIAWGLEHNLLQSQLPFKVARGPLDFRDPQVAADVVATLEQLAQHYACKAGLIIIDTVSRALCGGDENSPKDMGLFIANVARIQAAISVHVAMSHHQPVDGKERMRGHGALLGAVDTTIHVTKNGASRLAEVIKSSDHEEGQRIAFDLKSVTIDQDDGYGDPVTAPVVVEADMPAAPQHKRGRPHKTGIIAQRALADAVGDSAETVPPLSHIPAGAKAIPINVWRERAYAMGISAGEQDAKKKAFKRAVEELLAGGFIGMWNDWVWLV